MKSLVLVGLILGLSALRLFAADATKMDTPRASWDYVKIDPKTKAKLVVLHAKSWAKTDSPNIFKLTGVTGSIYQRNNSSYSDISFRSALLDERSGTLISGQDLALTNLP